MESAELAYAARVSDTIREALRRLGRLETELADELRETGREYYLSHPVGSGETMKTAMRVMQEQLEERAETAKREALLLERMLDTPYFGRVDFRLDPEPEARGYYIGLRRLDTQDRESLVYDWRAPIGSLFYYGETGPAAYDAPGGEQRGEIERLRQYTFREGRLSAHWDAQLRIDDAVLRDVLSGSAETKMRPIVFTIQREQNTAIRFDPAQDLAVFGPAGCGKTSVGLHRLAWLLYRAQTEGYAPRLCAFTANEAFAAYIADVLPSLGEETPPTMRYAALFRELLPRYRTEDALSHTEALLQGEPLRTAASGELYAPAFLAALEAETAGLEPVFTDVKFFGKAVVTARALEAHFSAMPRHVPVLLRMRTLRDWAAEETEDFYKRNRNGMLRSVPMSIRAEAPDRELLRRLRRQLEAKMQAALDAALDPSPEAAVLRAAESCCGADFTEALRARIESKKLLYPDAVALLCAAALLGSRPKEAPTHILLDEAQDLAPIQHKTLRLLYPDAVFTLLADPNQAILPMQNTCGAAELAALYGARRIDLQKSYRSVRPIAEFAKRFLPPEAADYAVFDRDGDAPFVHRTARAAFETGRIVKNETGGVGVLLRTAAEARAFHRRLLAYAPEATLIASERKPAWARIAVMPAALAKGLEFDCVIIPHAETLAGDPRAAYLMCTRALHRLHLILTPGSSQIPS